MSNLLGRMKVRLDNWRADEPEDDLWDYQHQYREAAETIEAMLDVLQEANAAINAAMAQVDAEWRNHDKAGDISDKIVREFRAKVRDVIAKATV